MAKFEKKVKAGCAEWMATYGDLVTLLLCFFIMMFATSSIDEAKYEKLLQAFNPNALLENTGGENIIGNLDGEQNLELQDYLSTELEFQAKLTELQNTLNNYIENENISDEITLEKDEDRLVIRFNSSLLFDGGEAKLKEDVKKHLKTLSQMFPKDLHIQIEGHTDNVQVQNPEFKDNWELSSMRAINVLEYLIDECNIDPSIMSAAGYSKYKPIASNDTKEGKAQNRRVEIILLRK